MQVNYDSCYCFFDQITIKKLIHFDVIQWLEFKEVIILLSESLFTATDKK